MPPQEPLHGPSIAATRSLEKGLCLKIIDRHRFLLP
jgi:hypothetical protein